MLWVLFAYAAAAGAILALLRVLWKLIDLAIGTPRVNAWPYVWAAIALSVLLAVVVVLAIIELGRVIA